MSAAPSYGVNSAAAGPPQPDIPMGPLNDAFKFFVANMSYNITTKDIKEFFSQFGPVNFVKIIYEKSGRSKGYGFLYMYTAEGDAAVESFSRSNNNRITLKGKSRVFLARHDQKREMPIRNPKKASRDQHSVVPATPTRQAHSGYAPTQTYYSAGVQDSYQPQQVQPTSGYTPATAGASNYATEQQQPASGYGGPPTAQAAPAMPTTYQSQLPPVQGYQAPVPPQGLAAAPTVAAPVAYAPAPAAPVAYEYATTATHPEYTSGMAPAPVGAPVAYDHNASTVPGYSHAPIPAPVDPQQQYAAPAASYAAAPGMVAPTYQVAPQQVPPQQLHQGVPPQPAGGNYAYPGSAVQHLQPQPHPTGGGYGYPAAAAPRPVQAPPPPPVRRQAGVEQALSTKILMENLPTNVIPKDVVQCLSAQSVTVRRCTMEYDRDPKASWCYAHVDLATPRDASRILDVAGRSMLKFRGRILQASPDTLPPPDGVHIPVGMGSAVSSGPRPAPRKKNVTSTPAPADPRGLVPPRNQRGRGYGRNGGRGRGGRSNQRDRRRDRPY